MKVFDDILTWEGYGGKFNLCAGRCRLRLFNLAKGDTGSTPVLKPMIAVVSDLPGDKLTTLKSVSVRACIGHVATTIVHRFKIEPNRMVLIEYYPRETYGLETKKIIPEKHDVVNLQWHGKKALFPNWRPLRAPLLDTVRDLIAKNP